jgi:hypothetical protein
MTMAIYSPTLPLGGDIQNPCDSDNFRYIPAPATVDQDVCFFTFLSEIYPLAWLNWDVLPSAASGEHTSSLKFVLG